MPMLQVRHDERPAGRVTTITVCRPEKLNVLDSATAQAMTDALASAALDDSLRAVVLAGEGERAFIGGADIGEMAGLTPDSARGFITRIHLLCAAIRGLPVPVVARMQGYTLGGGLEVAAACDMRIAAEGAKMGMPEVRVGVPSVIEAALLPQLIGWGRTRRLLLTGETIGSATALAWGLVEEVVPAAELDAAVERVLADILACGPRAIRLQKSLIRDWEGLTPEAAIERGIDCFAQCWTTTEPAERMAAFLEARAQRSGRG